MSTNSPCAACKFLRRKCMQGCVFAPYFPAENPARFTQVHRVFGASNVAKLLHELAPAQREDAVISLAYEAEARLHEPVLGCVGYVSYLEHELVRLQRDLAAAKKELCCYMRQEYYMMMGREEEGVNYVVLEEGNCFQNGAGPTC